MKLLHQVGLHLLVSIIQEEHYCWFLDPFNEIDLLKSVIPKFCIKLVQSANAPYTSIRGSLRLKILFGCLLCCSSRATFEKVISVAKVQLEIWNEIQVKEITVVSFHLMERILWSVVIMLHMTLLQTLKREFSTTRAFLPLLQIKGD